MAVRVRCDCELGARRGCDDFFMARGALEDVRTALRDPAQRHRLDARSTNPAGLVIPSIVFDLEDGRVERSALVREENAMTTLDRNHLLKPVRACISAIVAPVSSPVRTNVLTASSFGMRLCMNSNCCSHSPSS